MADRFCLILLIAFWLVAPAVSAQSLVQTPSTVAICPFNNSINSGPQPSASAACSAIGASCAAAHRSTSTWLFSGAGCQVISDDGGVSGNVSLIPGPLVCPSNSTLSGTSCTCNSGFVQDGSACIPYVDPQAAICSGLSGSSLNYTLNTTVRSLDQRSICDTESGGCSVTVKPTFCGTYGTDTICSGPGVFTGTTCTGTNLPVDPLGNPDSPRPDPLPPGTCPGTVNGVEVTVPCNDTTTSTKKESVNDDGNGNVQAKTENKVTACTGSSCNTTTTTTTTVNGTSSTTTNTTTQPKGQFCAENPGSVECGDGEGSAFSGTCESNFVCDGDAVQCATAKAVNDQYCIFEMSDSTKSLVQSVLDGTAVVDPRTTAQDLSVGVFDQNNPFGSSCPGDISAQVHGFSLTIPLASLCGWLQIIGNMLIAVSLFGATLFVVKGGNT